MDKLISEDELLPLYDENGNVLADNYANDEDAGENETVEEEEV